MNKLISMFWFVQEIEERTPMLKKQREDYESSLITINQLTSQLDAAMLVRP